MSGGVTLGAAVGIVNGEAWRGHPWRTAVGSILGASVGITLGAEADVGATTLGAVTGVGTSVRGSLE